MNKTFTVYLAFILFTEYAILFVNQSYGLFHYIFILATILTLFSINPDENPKLYLSLAIAPLIRITSLTTQGQIISDITLILLLATKELADTSKRLNHQILRRFLTMVIAPLLISFTLNITNFFGII